MSTSVRLIWQSEEKLGYALLCIWYNRTDLQLHVLLLVFVLIRFPMSFLTPLPRLSADFAIWESDKAEALRHILSAPGDHWTTSKFQLCSCKGCTTSYILVRSLDPIHTFPSG